MGPVRLGVGAEWLLDGRAFRVVQQLATNRFVARELKFNFDETLTEVEVLALYTHRESCRGLTPPDFW